MSEQDTQAAQEAENLEQEAGSENQTETGDSQTEPDYKAKANAFLAQLKEEKAKRKELEEKVAKLTPREEFKANSEISVKEMLSLKDQGYSDKEILSLHSYSVSMNKPIAEIAKDPLIAMGIESSREKEKSANAIPTPTSRVASVNGKPFIKLSDEEKARAWAAANAR